jgi:hypothetical protein
MFCGLFGFTKLAYYKHHACKKKAGSERLNIKGSVLALRRQMPRLGTRKLHYLLNLKSDINVGRDKLFSMLRKEGLLISRRKKYTVTTTQNTGLENTQI